MKYLLKRLTSLVSKIFNKRQEFIDVSDFQTSQNDWEEHNDNVTF